MKKNILLILLIISFILICILTLTNNINSFDTTIYNFLINFRSDFLDFFFINITKLANTLTILIIVIILLLTLKKEDAILIGTSTISSVVFNTIIKHIIRRPRPSNLRLIHQGGYSFPSGHAMISICVYGMLIYLVFKNIKRKDIKIFLISLLTLLILSIGLSRIYVGVHYPSDVLAGYLLATIILIILINFYNKFRGNLNGKTSNK